MSTIFNKIAKGVINQKIFLVYGAKNRYIAPKCIIMGTVRKSITFTEQQDDWIKLRIRKGDFTNDSEYIRNLIRRDQDQNLKLMELKQAIDEGLQSGKSSLKITDIMKRVDNGEL